MKHRVVERDKVVYHKERLVITFEDNSQETIHDDLYKLNKAYEELRNLFPNIEAIDDSYSIRDTNSYIENGAKA